MYEYLKALQEQFSPATGNERLLREIKDRRQALARQVGSQGRKELSRLLDAQSALQNEIALDNFAAGFRLAWSIASELAPSHGLERLGSGAGCGEVRVPKAPGGEEGRLAVPPADSSPAGAAEGRRTVRNVQAQGQPRVPQEEEDTVAAWLRNWYELYAKPNIRSATADRYQLMIEKYTIPRIGQLKLAELTSRELQTLYKDLMENGRTKGRGGLSGATVRSVHLTLHCAFERAVKERLIAHNPTDDCIAPKVQRVEVKTLLPEQLKAYLNAAGARGLLPMFYLVLVSGLRKGELVALLWRDLDVEHRTISVSKQYVRNPSGEVMLSRPKTETSVRQVSIPQDAVDLLIHEHSKHPDNPYMFPSPVTGKMYHPDSVVKLHEKMLKDAQLDHIRFHGLRHTFATLALQNGVDVKTVSSMLGHYDAGFTLRTYTHATRQQQIRAAETMGNFMAQVL